MPDHTFTMRQVLAEWTWYFLASARAGLKPTKVGLHNLIQNGALSHNWECSKRTFTEIWQDRLPTLPFLYVEQYHSKLDWCINPSQTDFKARVDVLVRDHEGRRTFFQNALYATDLLKALPNRRRDRNVTFPSVPESINSVAFHSIPLPANLTKAAGEPPFEHDLQSLDHLILQDEEGKIQRFQKLIQNGDE